MTVQIHTERLTAPDKRRCGDFVMHEITSPSHTHVFALSDGVGAHEHDWAASETTCRSVMDVVTRADGDLPSRLLNAVQRAHQDVQDLEGRSAGATATLVLFAWTEGESTAHFISIGDSRLYRVGASGVELLTEDDSKSIPAKIGGKVVTEAGVVKFVPGLTRAIGYASLGDVEVAQVSLRNGEMLAAVTDGFHELMGFEGRLRALFDHTNLAEGTRRELVGVHASNGRDDATMALLRSSQFPESEYDEYLNALRSGVSCADAGLFVHLMARACTRAMALAASSGRMTELKTHLAYLGEHRIVPARKDIVPTLDEVVKLPGLGAKKIHDALIELAQRAK